MTRSGSGLDPDITPANAALQIPRVARARGVSEEAVRRLVAIHTEGPQLGFLGNPRVPVLRIELRLDQSLSQAARQPRGDIYALDGIPGLPGDRGRARPTGRPVSGARGQRRRTFLDPVLRPVESLLYRWLGVRPEEEMSAGVYIVCFLLFGAGCTMVLFLVLIFQRWLPGGPADGPSDNAHDYGSGGEHRREFHHHDNLAGLWRRADAPLPGAGDVGWWPRTSWLALPGWRSDSPLSEALLANVRPPSAIFGWT